eukprot:TRINITY_DN19961_c0_g1_i1.p1 TRINITY_DN19961_c0_g1~~TRINITY_DN19961_c0_g1_i1.p1  ORF type:complete len:344 (+),score=136.67 TRINITY_DN19961_c0_g1_i1:68-1033(+)
MALLPPNPAEAMLAVLKSITEADKQQAIDEKTLFLPEIQPGTLDKDGKSIKAKPARPFDVAKLGREMVVCGSGKIGRGNCFTFYYKLHGGISVRDALDIRSLALQLENTKLRAEKEAKEVMMQKQRRAIVEVEKRKVAQIRTNAREEQMFDRIGKKQEQLLQSKRQQSASLLCTYLELSRGVLRAATANKRKEVRAECARLRQEIRKRALTEAEKKLIKDKIREDVEKNGESFELRQLLEELESYEAEGRKRKRDEDEVEVGLGQLQLSQKEEDNEKVFDNIADVNAAEGGGSPARAASAAPEPDTEPPVKKRQTRSKQRQ